MQEPCQEHHELSPRNESLELQARELHEEFCRAARNTSDSFVALAHVMAKVRDCQSWRFLLDSDGNQKYRSERDYVLSVIGPIARSRYFQIASAGTLTEGEHALPATLVEEIGITKAAELARLDPRDRSPEIVNAARKKTVPALKRAVQAKLNERLPPEERREPTRVFAISLPDSIADELDELLGAMIFMEGIRDGDRTLTLKQKAVHALIKAGREFYAVELAEAMEYKLAQDGIGDAPASYSLDPDEITERLAKRSEEIERRIELGPATDK